VQRLLLDITNNAGEAARGPSLEGCGKEALPTGRASFFPSAALWKVIEEILKIQY
jgi:hypothetical protein